MTFISRTRNQQYVEAHHLVPMSMQTKFSSSLDVPANIISLCATCHKLLHYGRAVDKKELLGKLHFERLTDLQRMQIDLDKRTLLTYYNSEFIDIE